MVSTVFLSILQLGQINKIVIFSCFGTRHEPPRWRVFLKVDGKELDGETEGSREGRNGVLGRHELPPTRLTVWTFFRDHRRVIKPQYMNRHSRETGFNVVFEQIWRRVCATWGRKQSYTGVAKLAELPQGG